MSVNFYAQSNICKHCQRGDEAIHLGKASVGWSFAIQANGFVYYKNWKGMKEWLKGKKITNEYGEKISRKAFIEWVESRKNIKDPEADWGRDKPFMIDGYKFYDYEFS